jgi:hypothetical protein
VLEAVSLVVALALGEARQAARAEARPALQASNAARARIGLLPRKAPARAASPGRSGRRAVPAPGLVPTFLGEPGTLPEAPVVAAREDPARLRLLADGVTTDVTISMRY